MPLKSNVVMVFTSYEVDDSGITLMFVAQDPGGNEPSEWPILIADTDLNGINNANQFRAMVLGKMNRKYRGQGVSATLDPLLQTTVTLP